MKITSFRNHSYASVSLQLLVCYHHFSPAIRFTFSQNFLFHAVAYIFSNRLLLVGGFQFPKSKFRLRNLKPTSWILSHSGFLTRKDSKNGKTKKENELTHTHHVNLHLTDTQYKIICKAAEEAGLSLSEYIHRQVIKGKAIAKYEIVADVPELKKLIAEFGKIGSNLN